MKRTISISALLMVLPLGVFAQTLNPSVEVTNDFQTRVLDFDKKGVDLELPDSMSVFATSFDYAVFENPYKGAYQFNPYNVRIVPDVAKTTPSGFYLNAGAGYTFSPVLQAVWTPKLKKGMTLNLYQDFNGYVGEYFGFGKGRDLSETAGITLGVDMKHTKLSLDASYRLLSESDALIDGVEHTASASLRLISKHWAEEFMSYDLNFKYDFSSEMSGTGLRENRFQMFGTLSPSTGLPVHLFMDFNAGFTDLSAMTGNTTYHFQVVPRVTFDLWKIKMSTGIGLAYLDMLYVYPDIKAHLPLLDNKLGIYAGITGAPKVNSYCDFKTADHHFNPLYVKGAMPAFSNEKINLYAGVGGCAFSRLQLDANVSWKKISSGALYVSDGFAPEMIFGDYSVLSALGRVILDLKNFRFDGNVCYTNSSVGRSVAFTEPAFTGGVSADYVWKHRLFAGVCADFSTARFYSDLTMPAWVDLGVHAEFKVSGLLSVWIKGSNLLAQRIEIIPCIARRGVCVTAGIRMDLR
ncbi:MAG: hypothetical protein MJY43_02525 [Bacteroidales bacterium]|nr:hypothetical protein [Bacteroidales bacterium]